MDQTLFLSDNFGSGYYSHRFAFNRHYHRDEIGRNETLFLSFQYIYKIPDLFHPSMLLTFYFRNEDINDTDQTNVYNQEQNMLPDTARTYDVTLRLPIVERLQFSVVDVFAFERECGSVGRTFSREIQKQLHR